MYAYSEDSTYLNNQDEALGACKVGRLGGRD